MGEGEGEKRESGGVRMRRVFYASHWSVCVWWFWHVYEIRVEGECLKIRDPRQKYLSLPYMQLHDILKGEAR